MRIDHVHVHIVDGWAQRHPISIRRPLRVQITLQLAICWALGFATLTVGHLNILSVTFAPVLIGLADNLGIHLAARYSEERTAGYDFRTAMEIAARQMGPGIVTAGIAVILAFYAVILADFPGLAELGFIAGSGELLCRRTACGSAVEPPKPTTKKSFCATITCPR